jgi:hypothetical protein
MGLFRASKWISAIAPTKGSKHRAIPLEAPEPSVHPGYVLEKPGTITKNTRFSILMEAGTNRWPVK